MNNEHIDEIYQAVIDGATTYKLTNQEIAGLLTSVMRTILMQDHNRKQLEELGLEAKVLTPEAVLMIQRIWTEEYIKAITNELQE